MRLEILDCNQVLRRISVDLWNVLMSFNSFDLWIMRFSRTSNEAKRTWSKEELRVPGGQKCINERKESLDVPWNPPERAVF